MRTYFVYILECADGAYYTGMTNNLTQRILEHEAGTKKQSFTARRRPVTLVWYGQFMYVQDAIDVEKQIKKWSKAKKEALINGDESELRKWAKKKF